MPESSAFANFNTALTLLHHVYFSPVIGALVERGVPDLLDDGPVAATEVAQRAGIDALTLTRVLRALAAFGAFKEVSPGVFANSPVSDLLRNHPGGLRNAALFYSSNQFLRSASGLGHSVVTGKAASIHVLGESIWDYFQGHPEEGEKFNRGLAEVRGDEHRQVSDAYVWAEGSTVVDVGGGAGSLLAVILGKRQEMRGVLIERSEVLPDAEQLLQERGVRDRCELVGQSFFEAMQVKGEVWTLCQVLHDWPDKECIAILKRCHEGMRATDRLLVIEMLTVPCEPNIPVGMVDMAMLMYFGEARQRTVDEYKTLFDATGFAIERVVPTAGAFSIVETRPV